MKNNKINTEWNFSLFYKSINDPRIETDMKELEKLCLDFYTNYHSQSLENNKTALKQSLEDYFLIIGKLPSKPVTYLTFLTHKNSSNEKAQSMLNLYNSRTTKCINNITFFTIKLGVISGDIQQQLLSDPDLAYYTFFLKCTFDDAKYLLSEAEEKIINLKRIPSSDFWNDSHDKAISGLTVDWKGKKLPLQEASNLIKNLNKSERVKLSKLVNAELKSIAFFSEAEINAVYINKKIDDELRGFDTPQLATILGYRNDPLVVENLVSSVTKYFPVAHKFFKIKAKLLKLKKLNYSDRAVSYKKIKGDFAYKESIKRLNTTLNTFDTKYADMLSQYVNNGQIDVAPQKGKHGGAYCWGTYENPTLVLLNHINDLNSYSTLAHEMGHAFHTELSKKAGPVYCQYSTTTAETASTFFESLAFDTFAETLSDSDKIVALHDKIDDEMQTIFRQIACFNFESDIHSVVRNKGLVTKEELANLHNKNMSAYLGPVFKMEEDDGYFFVQWGHIRRFFYVYTYAYGMLVSKVMLKRYKEDKSFIASIEKFLKAGGSDTPENIYKSIGIDVADKNFFSEGLGEIKKDVDMLERLVSKKK